MSPLTEHLDDYLRLRRGLGFQLGRHGEVLPRFVAYLEASGATTVTVELAVAWARLPEGIKPITVDFRISAVRGFARYLHALDPAHEIPPAGLLAAPRRRPTPYIYTPDQIDEVLRATRRLNPPLRAVTYRSLLGLLAATGMRSGEAFALTRSDVDLVDGMVTIRHAKFDRMRMVPLHRSVTVELRPTPRHVIGCAPRRAATGSSCRSPGARCGEARPTASSARSPLRSGCAPTPSIRAYMI